MRFLIFFCVSILLLINGDIAKGGGTDIRLVNGTNLCSGRVEVLHEGVWGTVCDDGWDLKNADVVCRQLGCGAAMEAKNSSYFGQGDIAKGGGTDIRLVNGTNLCSGRVEVLHEGVWGTVCDDGWDLKNADVVCRQLGCGAAMEAKNSSYFGQGSGPIWLDNVACIGNETSLENCFAPPWGTHNYEHDDAGVICQDIRLVNGSSMCSGRVEVLHDGVWGTVCDDGWDLSDAAVVCRQLGCGAAMEAKNSSYFGQDIRLVNGTNLCSGRVEIRHNGVWGTVCDDGWDLSDAAVVCRQLGCGAAKEAKSKAYFGKGSGRIWLDDVACTGNETTLKKCSAPPWGKHDCGHHKDAGVICQYIRLVNGTNLCSGRVEIRHNGVWGTVCDDGWDLSDAAVVCRQLGCGAAKEAKSKAYFGKGSGRIWLDDVACTGNETTLKKCSAPPWGKHDCGHHKDAGVICQLGWKTATAAPRTDIRLVNGTNLCSGRVEIRHNGVWGTVCDDGWDLSDAAVVCRQLGCGAAKEAKSKAYFGKGSGRIWLDDVACTGNETTLKKCSAPPWGKHDCGHHKDAGVICQLGWKTATAAPRTDIRLVNGTNLCSGRVEIRHNGVWGTVCDDGWDLSDAAVVCRQLGCGAAKEAKSKAYFGKGSGRIWLDDVACTGNETTLKKCSAPPWGKHDCGHHKDAGVICQLGWKTATAAPRTDIRLVNGTNLCSGRVEIRHNGVWGTVCDDGWDLSDAAVVCRQLGCGAAKEAKSKGYFGKGSGRIWLDDVACTGNETTLKKCSAPPWGKHDCGHHKDAGVICQLGWKTATAAPRTDIRLVNGTNLCSGRVEIRHNGVWGTVCDDGWDLSDAAVVCRQLGCGAAKEAKSKAYFGKGSGRIWLDDVACTGNETTLKKCSAPPWGKHDCGHHKDAGVICQLGWKTATAAPRTDIRLVNGTNLCSGRVEIRHNGVWGTVCDDGWDLSDAAVVCRQLGCGAAKEAKSKAYFGKGSGRIWLDDVACTGNETTLKKCSAPPWGKHDCGHHKDAGVICQLGWKTATAAPRTDIRLVNGTNLCSGRVEIRHNGVWGTVCDDGWDLSDAAVVCRQLGCGAAKEAKSKAYFGKGSGRIWLDDVACTGNETTLKKCSAPPWGKHDCGHHKDAGVICQLGWKTATAAPRTDIRLVNGTNLCSGRVEIRHNGVWGTVCDDGWDLSDAAVVCRQLGCGAAKEAKSKGYFGKGSGRIWLDDVACTGNETTLKKCSAPPWGKHDCGHHKDAGVICQLGWKTATAAPRTDIRLVNGTNLCSGRVEIRHNGVWGTVCDDGWDLSDAAVVCRQLGCGAAKEAKSKAYFGKGSGRIWLDDVACTGNETTLKKCSAPPWGKHDCGHHKDAGVICQLGWKTATAAPRTAARVILKTSISGIKDIRLVNGTNLCSGRVEIRHNGVWGTVCDDGWDLSDAAVVCRQLGCGAAKEAKSKAYFGKGSGRIWLDDVACTGNETTLKKCSAPPWGKHDCGHHKDAGVICQLGWKTATAAPRTDIRLVNGTNLCSGRVEIRHNGVWGTVCDDGWDLSDAAVVCRQLGCGAAKEAKSKAYFGKGSGRIWLDDVACTGNETTLKKCSAPPWGKHDCGHHKDAGVICQCE
ncbi:Scavenger receptor cysteine-rich type 1 protein M160 CD163 antigen-like 1 [Triplophysa tibetana]|uniref:Soluble scavenger receptor cysteine-rich domain-containing protein SSC5D n=1 Tax=Triplophysa tibetana TaxID=1572043 RepID=A0A5A9PX04_9TELE|nr:Scavenger receptor cysteine-rich type 1 protein M160 CD163 antigen-like 1 [Triplophysa tibetana]